VVGQMQASLFAVLNGKLADFIVTKQHSDRRQ
jgi:hypothetical protein